MSGAGGVGGGIGGGLCATYTSNPTIVRKRASPVCLSVTYCPLSIASHHSTYGSDIVLLNLKLDLPHKCVEVSPKKDPTDTENVPNCRAQSG